MGQIGAMQAGFTDRVIYRSQQIEIGVFRLYPGHPQFEDTGPISGNLLVFPRTAVIITHEGRAPVVTGPNLVMYYNRGQHYHRGRISRQGDRCEWFSFAPNLLRDVLQPYGPGAIGSDGPFNFTWGPVDPHTYLLQRQVVEHILGPGPTDRLFVEETLMAVLSRSVRQALRGRPQSAPVNLAHEALARQVQRLLAERFREGLSLDQIAAEFHYSPYHIARVFRCQAGQTIHQYLTQLRLRTSLEQVARGADLTEIALEFGFSSHSHFTMAFRQAFGAPPTEVRSGPMEIVRKILIAH